MNKTIKYQEKEKYKNILLFQLNLIKLKIHQNI